MRFISMAALAAVPFVAFGACSSDGPTGPTTGGLQISVGASGPDIDPDGFTITVDGSQTKTVVAGSSVSFTDLSPGDHVAAIGGIADNCRNNGAASITLTVTAGQNTPGAFAIGCDAIVSGSWSYSMSLELAGVPCTVTEDLSITQVGSATNVTMSLGVCSTKTSRRPSAGGPTGSAVIVSLTSLVTCSMMKPCTTIVIADSGMVVIAKPLAL